MTKDQFLDTVTSVYKGNLVDLTLFDQAQNFIFYVKTKFSNASFEVTRYSNITIRIVENLKLPLGGSVYKSTEFELGDFYNTFYDEYAKDALKNCLK